jgi:multiple sugar transport system permease protein
MARLSFLENKKFKEGLTGYLFVLPLLIYFCIFILLPILISFYYSFTDWNMRSAPHWQGLKNYSELLFNKQKQPYFWPSLLVTVKYIVLRVPIGLLLSLFLALMLNSRIRGENFFKLSYFLPMITSAIAIAALWKWLYDPAIGFINQLLVMAQCQPRNWLNEVPTALPSIAAMSIWQGAGYGMIIFLAGLKGIPDELYEAARIDGANAWQQFWNITLPLLRPVTFFLLVTTIIGSFQVFDQIYVLTGGLGGPEHSTFVYILNLYNQAFRYYRMGIACAMSYILFIIILIITWLQFKFVPQDAE